MSARTVIDSLEFARAAQELQGSVPVASLARLQDCLSDSSGAVGFKVTGGRDKERRLVLQVEAGGMLHLQCQRCLGPLAYGLRLSNTLLLVRPGEDPDLDDDPEAPDYIEASTELDVVALIEDEILLSLPFSPRHQDKTCARAWGTDERSAHKESAFARLAELRDPTHKQ